MAPRNGSQQIRALLARPFPRFLTQGPAHAELARSAHEYIPTPHPWSSPERFGAFVGQLDDLALKRDLLVAYLRDVPDSAWAQTALEETLTTLLSTN